MPLLPIFLLFSSVFSLFGESLRPELIEKAEAVANGAAVDMEAIGHYDPSVHGPIILDPAKKRSPDEYLALDMKQDMQVDNSLVCLAGIGNCTRCNFELSYQECSTCYLCCSTGTGVNRRYFTCVTVCLIILICLFTFSSH